MVHNRYELLEPFEKSPLASAIFHKAPTHGKKLFSARGLSTFMRSVWFRVISLVSCDQSGFMRSVWFHVISLVSCDHQTAKQN